MGDCRTGYTQDILGGNWSDSWSEELERLENKVGFAVAVSEIEADQFLDVMLTRRVFSFHDGYTPVIVSPQEARSTTITKTMR